MGPKKLRKQKVLCHPDRPRIARGLCSTCYGRQWWAAHPDFKRGRGRKIRRPKCHPDRQYSAKGLCKPCYMRKWNRTSDPDRHKEYWARRGRDTRIIRQAEGFHPLIHRRLRRHRLTPAQVVYVCRAKVCDLCGHRLRSWFTTHIDHDHATNTFRGVLCASCNTGLGHLGDTVAGIRRALAYLRKRRT